MAQANPRELLLTVTGVQRAPDGSTVFRMSTRDGYYIGRTNPTRMKAVKGDVLKVQANDFCVDAWGNVNWSNPNVTSRQSTRAHTWRYIQNITGEPPDAANKEGAPGAAGDIPSPGDTSITPADGPTLSAVHVDTPLHNVTVAYAGRKLRYRVAKTDGMQQIAYGVVLEPDAEDSQGDYMLPNQVEKAAHNYLKKALRGKSTVTRLQHAAPAFHKTKPSVVPVESFIAPVDFTYDGKEMIKKGTWVLAVHVEDPALWQDFLDGKYTGFSIGGSGVRRRFP